MATNLSQGNEKRIQKLEDANKWIVRAVLGAVVAGILAFVFKM